MSGLTLALTTAQSGLLANQQALNTVANNISNVNTPGYSRKIANLETRVVAGIGAGVQVGDVVRKVDEGLLKSLRLEISTLNAHDSRDPYYSRLQQLFGSPTDNTSLAHIMNTMTDAIEKLALNPSDTLSQSEVVRRGQEVGFDLKRMSDTIQELRLQADAGIKSATDRIDVILGSINQLNNKLIANSAINVDVSDLRDQRDSAIDELSSLIDVRYYYRGDGDVVVFTEGGRSLVDNAGVSLTHLQASSITATTNHSEGDLNGIFVGTAISQNDITEEVRNGRLKGLIDMRDSILPNLQSQIDEFATQLRDTTNAAHNLGTAFPGQQTMTGTRYFIDSANQTITFNGTSDTTVALLDPSGNQNSTTTIRTLIGGATASIDTVASSLQTWLRANGASGANVAVNTAGNFAIDLNTTTTNLVFRDESATAAGSSAAEASITFEANGTVVNGTETVTGFSNFFGLNDFYVDTAKDNIQDSKILSPSYTLGASTTLTFFDKTSGVSGAGKGSVALTKGQTLDQIVAAVNNAAIGITATKVPDGAGFRLRLSESTGVNMVVSASDSFPTDVGLHVSNSGLSALIGVRANIASSPGSVSRSSLQWDSNKGAAGEYVLSPGDDTSIQAWATNLSKNSTFSASGGLVEANVNFTTYAISIISFNATLASTNQAQFEFQQTLTQSLQTKSDNFRGVSLDEEMTQLMLFEQAYGAAARLITTIQKMFDALEAVV